jgi:hypothetical protein
MLRTHLFTYCLLAGLPFGLGACGGSPSAPAYTLSATVSGLAGSVSNVLTLQDINGVPLQIKTNGVVTLSVNAADGSSYQFSISGHPRYPTKLCSLSNGTGVVNGADVTNISISCQPGASVNGTVRGLSLSRYTAGVTLGLSNGDRITLQKNGDYSFKVPLVDGSAYQVSVVQQPSRPAQQCTLNNATGTSNGDVWAVDVSCSAAEGSVLFAADIRNVFAFNVRADGSLSGISNFTVQESASASVTTLFAVDSSASYIFSATNTGELAAYAYNAQGGAASALSRVAVDSGTTVPATAVAVHPSGQWVYLNTTRGMYSFDFSDQQQLSRHATGSSVLADHDVLAVSGDGTRLAAAGSTLAIYLLDPNTGVPSLASSITVPNGESLREIHFEPNSRLLFGLSNGALSGSSSVYAWSVSDSGQVAFLASAGMGAGVSGVGFVVAPDETLYVSANSGTAGMIRHLLFDGSISVFSNLVGSPYLLANGGHLVAVSPVGSMLYVSGLQDSNGTPAIGAISLAAPLLPCCGPGTTGLLALPSSMYWNINTLFN